MSYDLIKPNDHHLHFSPLKIYNRMRNPASMTSAATTTNSCVDDVLLKEVCPVDCLILVTSAFLQ